MGPRPLRVVAPIAVQLCSMPRLWRFEEVFNQPLHGNVHLLPSSQLSGRLTRAKEARCLRMAGHELRFLSDMLWNTTNGSSQSSAHGWEFMSSDDANFATGISHRDYEALRAAIPVESIFRGVGGRRSLHC